MVQFVILSPNDYVGDYLRVAASTLKLRQVSAANILKYAYNPQISVKETTDVKNSRLDGMISAIRLSYTGKVDGFRPIKLPHGMFDNTEKNASMINRGLELDSKEEQVEEMVEEIPEGPKLIGSSPIETIEEPVEQVQEENTEDVVEPVSEIENIDNEEDETSHSKLLATLDEKIKTARVSISHMGNRARIEPFMNEEDRVVPLIVDDREEIPIETKVEVKPNSLSPDLQRLHELMKRREELAREAEEAEALAFDAKNTAEIKDEETLEARSTFGKAVEEAINKQICDLSALEARKMAAEKARAAYSLSANASDKATMYFKEQTEKLGLMKESIV